MYVKRFLPSSVSAGGRHVEFHVSRNARNRYSFEDGLFSKDGHVITADYKAVMELSKKINTLREREGLERMKISAADLFALGLMHEIFHHIIENYSTEAGGEIFHRHNLDLEKDLESGSN